MALEEDSQLSLLFNTSTAESSVPSKNLTLDEYINGLREEMIPETIVYTASWFLGTAGNLFILHQLQTSQAHKSKINFLIRHLAIADLMVVWFTITIEIMWRICVTWNTPDLGCRFVQVMRTFGLYLTSMIIISITLDRFYAFVYPMSVFTSKNRNRKFLICSYTIALAASIPNGIVFHLMEHPDYPGFFQCVTIGSFSRKWAELAYNTASICGFYFIPVTFIIVCYTIILRNIDSAANTEMIDREAGSSRSHHRDHRATKKSIFYRLRIPVQFSRSNDVTRTGNSMLLPAASGSPAVRVAHVEADDAPGQLNQRSLEATGMERSAGAELECIPLPTHLSVNHKIRSRITEHGERCNGVNRNGVETDVVQENITNNSTESRPASCSPEPFTLQSQNRKALMIRARRKTLQLSISIVITFVICWTPYALLLLWELIDMESLKSHIPEWIRALLYILAVFNSCVNPFIHSGHIFVQFFRTSRLFRHDNPVADATITQDQRNIRSVSDARETHL